MKQDIEKQVEDILDSYFEHRKYYQFNDLKRELLTLIQKSNKKAVEDFVVWFNTKHFEESVTYERFIATDEHKEYLTKLQGSK